jgi:hypothetical protein
MGTRLSVVRGITRTGTSLSSIREIARTGTSLSSVREITRTGTSVSSIREITHINKVKKRIMLESNQECENCQFTFVFSLPEKYKEEYDNMISIKLLFIIESPHISVPPTSAVTSSGSDHVFTCQANGVPVPTITWSYTSVRTTDN